MKIATFNANSLRARLDIVLNWLDENQPDVLCVQETKVQDCDFPGAAFDNSGYEFVFKGQKSYNGVAVFSKHPIEDVQFGLDDEPFDAPRLAKVRIKDLNIVNTYIPQGFDRKSEKFAYKLEWFARLKKFFENHFSPTDNVLWLGDMNVAPEAIDVHSPKRLLGHVCFCQEVWDAYADVKSWGFSDVMRSLHPDEQIFTFWDYRRKNALEDNVGWRIDHFLATKPLLEKCKSCYVDTKPRTLERPSDHTFVIVEIDL